MALDNIKRHYGEMFQAEKKVADYILENPGKVVDMSIAELAKASETSDATIIRMCRHIGLSGFYQLKISLASNLGKLSMEDHLGKENSPKDMIEFFGMVSRSVQDTARNINMEVFFQCVEVISEAETVYTAAWGNTGQITGDLAHRLARSGIKSFVSDIPEYSLRSIALGGSGDVLVAISHSGATIHVIHAIELAKELGMKVILITDTSQSEAAARADLVLSTEIKNPLFSDFGGASHVFELIVVDALLYFIKERPECRGKIEKTEFMMSGYKL